jgi:hypothetical protein
VNACKHNLHGRIIWPKGATPLTVAAVKSKLAPMWKDLSQWGVSSLGKGFYEFVFSTLEDVRRVRSIASWNLNPGLLKLFAWSKDFNPRVQQNVSAQVCSSTAKFTSKKLDFLPAMCYSIDSMKSIYCILFFIHTMR